MIRNPCKSNRAENCSQSSVLLVSTLARLGPCTQSPLFSLPVLHPLSSIRHWQVVGRIRLEASPQTLKPFRQGCRDVFTWRLRMLTYTALGLVQVSVFCLKSVPSVRKARADP